MHTAANSGPRIRVQHGEPVTALSVLIPLSLHQAVKIEAAKRNTSVTRLVIELLAGALSDSQADSPAAAE